MPVRMIGLLLGALLLAAACATNVATEVQIQAAGPAALQEIENSLRRRVKEKPDDAEVLLLLARTLLRRGALAEAEQFALQADQLAPAQGVILALLGEIYLAQDKRFRALTIVTQAIQFDPSLLSGYVTMARAHALLGEPARAFRALDECIRRERRYFPAWYERARILFETGALNDAEAALDEALRVNPSAKEAQLLRIKIVKKEGRLGRADYLTEVALENWPDDKDFLLEKLDTRRQRQDWQAAGQVLERLRKLGPLTPDAQLAQLELYRAQGLIRAYEDGLNQLLAEQPRFTPALLLQTKGLLAEDKTREAVAAISKAVDLDPGNVEASYWRAVAQYQAGEVLQGDSAMADTTRLAPGYPPLRLLRARRLLLDRRLDAASPLLEDFLKDFPSDPEALLLKSELRVLQGDYAGAQLLLTGIPPVWDEQVLQFSRARLAYLNGDYRAVIEFTGPMVKPTRPSWRVVYLHGAALARLGRHKEAITLLQPYLRLAEADGRFHRLLGDIQQLAGDRASAEKAYAEGLQIYPRKPILVEGLSRVAIDAEKWNLAREVLEGGIERPSDLTPIFLERLSLVYLRLGKPQQAKTYRERYLTAADPVIAELQRPSDQGVLFNMTLPPLENTFRSIPVDQRPAVVKPSAPRG
jgi:tetratricopeptide (TPR) repeat protein